MNAGERIGFGIGAPLDELVSAFILDTGQLRGEEVAGGSGLRLNLGSGYRAGSELQRGDGSLFIQVGADVDGDGRAFAAPLGHIGAGPLHAHGLAAHGLREQHRVGGHILEAGAAVRTGILDPDDAHHVGRNVEHLGDAELKGVRLLRAAPDSRDSIGGILRDGAARAHGCVGLERPIVTGFHLAAGAGEHGGRVAFLRPLPRGFGRDGAHVGVKIRRKDVAGLVPRDLERLRGANRGPLGFRHHADKVTFHNDFGEAGMVFTEASSKLTKVAPALNGRMTRACSMPSMRISVA